MKSIYCLALSAIIVSAVGAEMQKPQNNSADRAKQLITDFAQLRADFKKAVEQLLMNLDLTAVELEVVWGFLSEDEKQMLADSLTGINEDGNYLSFAARTLNEVQTKVKKALTEFRTLSKKDNRGSFMSSVGTNGSTTTVVRGPSTVVVRDGKIHVRKR